MVATGSHSHARQDQPTEILTVQEVSDFEGMIDFSRPLPPRELPRRSLLPWWLGGFACVAVLAVAIPLGVRPQQAVFSPERQKTPVGERGKAGASAVLAEDTVQTTSKGRHSTGTAFAVAVGYLVTSHHVVADCGLITVWRSEEGRAYPVTVVARDEVRDLALLRVELPPDVELPALPLLGGKPGRRGQAVATLGYPSGKAIGCGLKLTCGVISAVPEPGLDDRFLFDARVNPGNSGGPLLDARGNVIGLVAAKSGNRGIIESYGLAVPGWDLEVFVREHLRDYKPVAVNDAKLDWDEIDERVSKSVLRVVASR